ncbi:hypothetical protein Pcinc_020983 [Petrolisthes cinctipes]|uniref:receptor protein-tyrosine kinase n=1 Tax=Petrolisthes cinctipes TaxID=88211 RepID=A0AAE1FH18_PETCI|nr:hypothetical protein Pcinc_020983 [Petrolisthes cinctipes]
MNLQMYSKNLPPKRYLYHKWTQKELVITLDTSQRLSHQLATALAKILLQEGLGYQNVTVKHYPNTFNYTQALDRLKPDHSSAPNNGIPEAMFNMEVWVPPTSSDDKISSESDCGKHASGGRFGWYVSRNSYTEAGVITDHWRSFQRPKVTALFAFSPAEEDTLYQHLTRKTSGDGYYCEEAYCTRGVFTPELCRNRTYCATLLVGNHSKYNEFLVEQVEESELLVKIAWVGPHLTPELLCTFRKDRPLMFFDWWPNSLSNLDSFMPISFASCLSSYSRHPYLCNYELHALKKYMWSDLQRSAKLAAEAIKRFFLSEKQYKNLIKTYTERTSNCSTDLTTALHPSLQPTSLVDDIACDWLREQGRDAWYEWLPGKHDSKTVLWIGGIFPMSNESSVGFTDKSLVNATRFAYQRINQNEEILQDYKLEVIFLNGGCQRETVLTAFMHHVRKDSSLNEFEQMIGILGPACSDTVEPIAGVAATFNTVVMSYSAEGAIFNNYTKYPYFFRTIPENQIYWVVYMELFQHFNWKQVGALTEDTNKYSEYITVLMDNLPDEMKVESVKLKQGDVIKERLLKLKQSNYKIIIGDFYANKAREVLCQAYQLNMTARYDYVWFLPRWFTSNWYNTSLYTGKDRERINCTTAEMLEAVDRHMSLGFAYYAPDEEVTHENMTVDEWRKKYKENNQGSDPPDYAGYTYDAVWAYALALNTLLREDRKHVSNLHTKKTLNRFAEIIGQTSFPGVSGDIHFRRNVSEKRLVNIMQFEVNEEKTGGIYHTVGSFTPTSSNSGLLTVARDSLLFFGDIPKDGHVGDTCLFKAFSDLLDVSCDITIVIVMVLIFTLVAIFLFILFIVYKKRYEKKMFPEQHAWPLSELISLDEWELPREKVVINRTIGEGAFGTVFGGECQFGDNSPWVAVAVKTLKVGSTVEEKLDFLGEAEMMKRFNHKNIVQLLGLCTHQEPIYMIMEFMLYGDLKTYLLARRHLVSDKTSLSEEDEINSKRLTSMSQDVCRALLYLSELRYVHRDVACRNCLVSAERVVKLSDFGMTRPMYESDYYRFNRRGMLPVRWMSPESLEDGIFTNKSDMWSFGVLLYEIITFGNFPFQGMSNNQVLEHVRIGNTITLPKSVKPQLERLLLNCWSTKPQDRPTFTDMLETLTLWPRLITPCLEVPSAAVQLNDTDSVNLVLPTVDPSVRRSSAPNARLPNARVRHVSGDDVPSQSNAPILNSMPHPVSAPKLNMSTGVNSITHPPLSTVTTPTINSTNALNSLSWNRTPYENGGGPSLEPLLPQTGDGYVTRYVCLQRTKSGENSDLESPPNNMTAV